ncbi:class I SAM-dependent methyltransferase [Nonomuraea sp. PA05]|uniref:class I SAM-dependent methyltransferase n=1 Tax=Nonomuraea sp. PA05 TaxID=2604466 RepID=UPI0011D41098|nr:class I SAM-dependent methyltransferase [Nonomuraea sp. PA05]TYB47508.1 class I SAM-dependent methyltransferase [Nonomuraea sp. PA05]
MTHAFDKDYWEQHWHAAMGAHPPNPYLVSELGELRPGTALDAGCGGGAEAIWLAGRGWQVTAADLSARALALAAEQSAAIQPPGRVRWVEADLTTWRPDEPFDLVMTHYAHPAMPQLDFYERIAGWVAPGGTLLIVGHSGSAGHGHHPPAGSAGHGHHPPAGSAGHGHHPPPEASVTPAAITGRLPGARWEIVTAEERHRTPAGRTEPLHDVVVRATRRP